MTDLYRNEADPVTTGFTFDMSAIEKALKNIHSRKIPTKVAIDGELFSEVRKVMSSAIDTGVQAPDIQSGFARELKQNADVFSAFKVHRMGRDMASRMLDENGNLKPFSQFKKDTADIVDHHVNRWLRTEYDTAVRRAHKASEMRQFIEEADVFPNIKWLPSTAIHPRESHIPFYLRIWPVDHPFWDEHKPGDEWGCQCDWEATDEPPTDNSDLEVEEVKPSPGLAGNPAKTGQIFSDDHPYFPAECSGCPFNTSPLKIITNQKKDCYKCKQILRAISEAVFKATPKQLDASKKRVAKFKESIPKGQMKVVEIEDKIIDKLHLSRQVVKGWCSHPFKFVLERNKAIINLQKLFEKATYYGWAEDETVLINGAMKPKHPDTRYWLYYKVVINGEEAYICIKRLYDGRYVPYCLDDQRSWHDTAPKVKQELPPES